MARYFRAASQFAFPFFAEKDLTTKLFSSRQKIYQLVYRLLTTRLLTRYQLGAVLSSGNSEDPITEQTPFLRHLKHRNWCFSLLKF